MRSVAPDHTMTSDGGACDRDKIFMALALAEAEKAAQNGDVPVGAVLVSENSAEYTVLSCGHNTKEQNGIALGHAEINAISEACQARGSWRLSDCTLYVTMEPCPMCAGAIQSARIPRVVCGTRDPIAGAMGSVWAIHRHPTAQQAACEVEYGCMEQEAREILQRFFRERRKSKLME